MRIPNLEAAAGRRLLLCAAQLSAPPLILVHGGRDHCRNRDWVAERLAMTGT